MVASGTKVVPPAVSSIQDSPLLIESPTNTATWCVEVETTSRHLRVDTLCTFGNIVHFEGVADWYATPNDQALKLFTVVLAMVVVSI